MSKAAAVFVALRVLAVCLLVPVPARAQEPPDAQNVPAVPGEAGTTGNAEPFPEQDPVTRRDAGIVTFNATQNAGRLGAAYGALSDMQFYSDLQAGFRYSSEPSNLSWSVGASSAGRHQPDGFQLLGDVAGAGVGYSRHRIQLSASQSVGYIPSFYFGAPPLGVPSSDAFGLSAPSFGTVGMLPPAAVDFGVAIRPAYMLASGASASVGISRRSSLTASYGFQRTDFVNQAEPSLVSWSGSVRFSEELTKFLGVHLGYARRSAQYSLLSGTSPVTLNDVDFGVDLHKALSFTVGRGRTTLSFGTGSTFTSSAASTLPATLAVGRQLHVNANANLDHLIGRTGHVGVSYNRGVELAQGFVAPVFSDSVIATAGGNLSRRLVLSMSAAMMLGAVGQSGAANRYNSYTGSAGLSYGISRSSTLFADYLVNQYEIGQSVQLINTMPRNQARMSGRVGFSVRLPVIRQWVRPRGQEGQ